MGLSEPQAPDQGNEKRPFRAFYKSLKATPIYRNAPTKRLQRSLSEDTAKLERRILFRKTALLPKMGARYGGQATKKQIKIYSTQSKNLCHAPANGRNHVGIQLAFLLFDPQYLKQPIIFQKDHPVLLFRVVQPSFLCQVFGKFVNICFIFIERRRD